MGAGGARIEMNGLQIGMKGLGIGMSGARIETGELHEDIVRDVRCRVREDSGRGDFDEGWMS